MYKFVQDRKKFNTNVVVAAVKEGGVVAERSKALFEKEKIN